jgi:hypothetical protein
MIIVVAKNDQSLRKYGVILKNSKKTPPSLITQKMFSSFFAILLASLITLNIVDAGFLGSCARCDMGQKKVDLARTYNIMTADTTEQPELANNEITISLPSKKTFQLRFFLHTPADQNANEDVPIAIYTGPVGHLLTDRTIMYAKSVTSLRKIVDSDHHAFEVVDRPLIVWIYPESMTPREIMASLAGLIRFATSRSTAPVVDL